jgi:hypothetical protein
MEINFQVDWRGTEGLFKNKLMSGPQIVQNAEDQCIDIDWCL